MGFAADGLYICTTHSGMTLAPALAEMAAEEVASGGSSLAPDLAPYRPQRSFDDGSTAYSWDLYHEAKEGQAVASQS